MQMKRWSLAAAVASMLMSGTLLAAQAGAGGAGAGGAGAGQGGNGGAAADSSDAESPAGQESQASDRERDRDSGRSNQDPENADNRGGADNAGGAATDRANRDRANQDAARDRQDRGTRGAGDAANNEDRGTSAGRERANDNVNRNERTTRGAEDTPAVPGADRRGDQTNRNARNNANRDNANRDNANRDNANRDNRNSGDRDGAAVGGNADRAGGRDGQGQSDNPDRVALGVTLWDREDGVVVRQVSPNSPAARIGLRAGDRIVRFNGQDYDSYDTFITDVGRLRASQSYDIVVDRDGQTQNLTIQPSAWNSVYVANSGRVGSGRVIQGGQFIQGQYGQSFPQQYGQGRIIQGQQFGVARPDLNQGAASSEIDQLRQRIEQLEQEVEQLRATVRGGQSGAAIHEGRIETQGHIQGQPLPPRAAPQRVNRQPQVRQDDLGLPPGAEAGAAQPGAVGPGAVQRGDNTGVDRDLSQPRIERREAGAGNTDR